MPSHHLPTITQAYGIPLRNLRYLHRGWGGDCYTAETAKGERYFLKFHDPSETLALAASSRDFYLSLTFQLYQEGILTHIPHPLPTRDGQFSLQIGSYILVITNYIEGELIGFEPFSIDLLSELAKIVGILHNSLEMLTFEKPFIDDFDFPFRPIITQFLTEEHPPEESISPGKRAMQGKLMPKADQIQDAIQNLRELQVYAQSAEKAKVICHTDIHGGNLMRGQDGALYLLDWENAMIAPPEHDLIFFVGEQGFSEHFFPVYKRYFPTAQIDLKLLEFYFYRRALEDLADFILRVDSQTSTTQQDQEDIQESVDILERLPKIQETIQSIQSIQ